VPVRKAAEAIAVSPEAVRTWIQRGELPAYRAGRLLRVRMKDLHDFLRSSPPHETRLSVEEEADRILARVREQKAIQCSRCHHLPMKHPRGGKCVVRNWECKKLERPQSVSGKPDGTRARPPRLGTDPEFRSAFSIRSCVMRSAACACSRSCLAAARRSRVAAVRQGCMSNIAPPIWAGLRASVEVDPRIGHRVRRSRRWAFTSAGAKQACRTISWAIV
jgi:excisionase family DNA binding protein